MAHIVKTVQNQAENNEKKVYSRSQVKTMLSKYRERSIKSTQELIAEKVSSVIGDDADPTLRLYGKLIETLIRSMEIK